MSGEALGPDENLLDVNFNQDCTSLAIGTKCGYKLFSLASAEKLEKIYESEGEPVCIVERLFSSSLVAIVSVASPRILKVCHFKKGTEICNYSYSNSILAVRLNRQRLIVCLEESLYIHNIRDMKVLHTIQNTPPNPVGLCALSINNDNSYLAYPGSNQIGEVQIFDTVTLRAVTMIPAHDSQLASIAFNTRGILLATASVKGTVIRVFSIPEGNKLFEFRRGMKRCVTINSLSFSPDSLHLAASSNTETVHVFKLETPDDRLCEDQGSWMGYFGQALKSSANYLPSQVTEMINQGRSLALARLPTSGVKNVCVLSTIQKVLRLLVASGDGYLYIYNVDFVEGGECALVRQHRMQETATLTHGDPNQEKPTQPVGITYAASVKKVEPNAASSAASPSPPGKPLAGSPSARRAGHDHNPRSSYATAVKTGVKRCGPDCYDDLTTDDVCGDGHETLDYIYGESRWEGGNLSEEEVRWMAGEGGEEDAWLASWFVYQGDSRPFTDVEHGATGGEVIDPNTIGALRLDDDNEFPPMCHKNE